MAKSLKQLREEAKSCQDCPLWANATQTVFGAGDLPFVGPAGRLLDRALEAAGVEREGIYVTNAVKHFKWQMRGKFVESPLAPFVFATFHPSALLRLRDDKEKEAAFAQLVDDFKLINRALEDGKKT